MQPKISLQTFTIRAHTKSPSAIESALDRVAEIGIGAIELAYIKLKPAELAAVARACERHGIDIGSSQITYDFLLKNKERVVEFHGDTLDCQITSVSVLPQNVILGDASKMLSFAEELNELGEFYRSNGITLCFHHHDFEFRRYGDLMGLDLLLQNTSPENLGLVIDTYWSQRGGKCPQDFIAEHAERLQVIHLRDYSVRRKFFDMVSYDTELGNGNLDISAIVEACKQAKVRYMAIEHASKQPFASLEHSVKHLKQLGYAELF